ncbi:Franean1_4349 family RiPP [Polyangium jinanense]|uniref:Franean1_4349 family RiPP n=1 Tax=Polyangium jinanense TaxID=2829994 RepID=A0A9X3X9P9_9BACT|nr:Franean1_4349 family RiPP [Polyangium jinanense]MDC3961297.1 Franean1_4349 family RiPP [Polyangium jinanense]MDC3984071.1 Franean1_4349 family RiPP [Polyangium jinanense]
MSKKSVEELIGRALTDVEFRKKLLAAPEATLTAEGYEAVPEVIEAIKNANPDEVNAMAQGLESQMANRKAAS